MGTRANFGPERECKKPRRTREEWGGVYAARENSLARVAREGISGFAAKRFVLSPTPASYAGDAKCDNAAITIQGDKIGSIFKKQTR